MDVTRIEELCEEIHEEIKTLESMTGITAPFTVDLEERVVVFGEDSFKIKERFLEKYLEIRLERFKIMVKMAESTGDREKLEKLINLNNNLVMAAVLCYETKEDE